MKVRQPIEAGGIAFVIVFATGALIFGRPREVAAVYAAAWAVFVLLGTLTLGWFTGRRGPPGPPANDAQ